MDDRGTSKGEGIPPLGSAGLSLPVHSARMGRNALVYHCCNLSLNCIDIIVICDRIDT